MMIYLDAADMGHSAGSTGPGSPIWDPEAAGEVLYAGGYGSVRRKGFLRHTYPEDARGRARTVANSPALWAARRRPLSVEKTRGCRRKFGGLRWLGAASRPDTRVRLAQLATKVNPLQVGNICCIHDFVKAIKSWRPQTTLRLWDQFSHPHPCGVVGYGVWVPDRGRSLSSGVSHCSPSFIPLGVLPCAP